MLTKDAGTWPGTVRVTFEFPTIVWAEAVHLVGELNAWDERSLPLSRSRRAIPTRRSPWNSSRDGPTSAAT